MDGVGSTREDAFSHMLPCAQGMSMTMFARVALPLCCVGLAPLLEVGNAALVRGQSVVQGGGSLYSEALT